jgi:hypothetical protein
LLVDIKSKGGIAPVIECAIFSLALALPIYVFLVMFPGWLTSGAIG